MVNTKIRSIIFFEAEDGEALHGKLKTSFKGCVGMCQILLETPRMEQNG